MRNKRIQIMRIELLVALTLTAGVCFAETTGGRKALVPVPDLAAYRAAWAAERPRLLAETASNRTAVAMVTVRDAEGRPVANESVRLRLVRHAFNFGCNILVLGQLGAKNAAYETAFTNLFNLATTTFCLKVIEKEEGKFLFEDTGTCEWRRPPPDRVLAFCRKNGLRVKGQPLMAGSWHPDWAAKRTPEQCRKMYADYFDRVARRYGDSYTMFDLVNEADCHRAFPLYTKNLTYIDWALETVAEKFPKSCSICINELSEMNSRGAPADRYYQVVKRIHDKGLRLDGVGFQFHLFSDNEFAGVLSGKNWTPQELRATYDRMGALGIPLYITEITIPSTLGGLDLGERLQAEAAENFYRFWFARADFAGITWWNLCDGAAWKNEGSVLSGLVDSDMRRKPVYEMLYRLIRREWTTDVTVKTDANGRASFRGYFGDYEATAADKKSFFSLSRGEKHFDVFFK